MGGLRWGTVRGGGGGLCTVHGARCNVCARCTVHGAMCVCTVHGAGCNVCARCTVHGAMCVVHGARCGALTSPSRPQAGRGARWATSILGRAGLWGAVGAGRGAVGRGAQSRRVSGAFLGRALGRAPGDAGLGPMRRFCGGFRLSGASSGAVSGRALGGRRGALWAGAGAGAGRCVRCVWLCARCVGRCALCVAVCARRAAIGCCFCVRVTLLATLLLCYIATWPRRCVAVAAVAARIGEKP